MRQGDLFETSDAVETFDLPDAELVLIRGFLPVDLADRAFETLRADTDWEQEEIVMFGRPVLSPRLTAWFGDPGSTYLYSGLLHDPMPWTPLLTDLRARVEQAIDHRFNSVLANYYRDGDDGVGWHSDDERELGRAPVIGSLSLGATRVFQMKHKERDDLPRVDIELPHGSLLTMAGNCQRCWKHQIPKRRGANAPGPRINLTFRRVLGGRQPRLSDG